MPITEDVIHAQIDCDAVSDSLDEIASTIPTLRQYYAAKMMQAMITRYGPNDPVRTASVAFEYADAMIKYEEEEDD